MHWYKDLQTWLATLTIWGYTCKKTCKMQQRRWWQLYMRKWKSYHRLEVVDHKFYKVNFLSSPDLFDDFHAQVTDYCGTAEQNCKGIMGDSNTLKLK